MDITNIPSLENVGEFMPAWLYFILSKRLGQGTWNVQTQRTVFGEKTGQLGQVARDASEKSAGSACGCWTTKLSFNV